MDITQYEKKLEQRIKNSVNSKWCHSFLHEVTWEVCQYVGEPGMFGKWLGAVKRKGPGQMRSLLKDLKEKGIKNPKYVFACTRNPQ